MQRELVIVGAGGHGQVVAECAEACGYASIRFFDDRADCAPTAFPVHGPLTTLEAEAPRGAALVVAVGDARARLALLARFESAGFVLATLVHPRAIVSPRAALGDGTVVFAGAVVQAFASIGRGVILNTSSSVDHHAVLADGVHVCPGVHLAGNVRVGARTWIGIGAVVRQGITLGSDVVVGAGAAVVADVPDGVTALGVPARARV